MYVVAYVNINMFYNILLSQIVVLTLPGVILGVELNV